MWRPMFILLVALTGLVTCSPIKRQVGFSADVGVTAINNTEVCAIDEVIYTEGQLIPTVDPCEECQCRPPGFACTIKQCPERPGCRTIKQEGQCCPKYNCDCVQDGVEYLQGEEVDNPANPCETCRCDGGEVVCQVIRCPWRSDCEGIHTAGTCCPSYDHCPPEDPAVEASQTAEGQPQGEQLSAGAETETQATPEANEVDTEAPFVVSETQQPVLKTDEAATGVATEANEAVTEVVTEANEVVTEVTEAQGDTRQASSNQGEETVETHTEASEAQTEAPVEAVETQTDTSESQDQVILKSDETQTEAVTDQAVYAVEGQTETVEVQPEANEADTVTTQNPEEVVDVRNDGEEAQTTVSSVVRNEGEEAQTTVSSIVVRNEGEEAQTTVSSVVVRNEGEEDAQTTVSSIIVRNEGEEEAQTTVSSVVRNEGEEEAQTTVSSVVVRNEGEEEAQTTVSSVVVRNEGEDAPTTQNPSELIDIRIAAGEAPVEIVPQASNIHVQIIHQADLRGTETETNEAQTGAVTDNTPVEGNDVVTDSPAEVNETPNERQNEGNDEATEPQTEAIEAQTEAPESQTDQTIVVRENQESGSNTETPAANEAVTESNVAPEEVAETQPPADETEIQPEANVASTDLADNTNEEEQIEAQTEPPRVDIPEELSPPVIKGEETNQGIQTDGNMHISVNGQNLHEMSSDVEKQNKPVTNKEDENYWLNMNQNPPKNTKGDATALEEPSYLFGTFFAGNESAEKEEELEE